MMPRLHFPRLVQLLGAVLLALIFSGAPLRADGEGTNEAIPVRGVVATVNGEALPAELFLHEFRSNFFRHPPGPDARRKVLGDFTDRFLLYQEAVKAGVKEDPAFAAKLAGEMAYARSFADYQLRMQEMKLVTDEYLRRQKLEPSRFAVTDDDILTLIKSEPAMREASGGRLENVPPSAKEQLRERLQLEKQAEAIAQRLKELRETAAIEVNEKTLETIPLPRVIQE